MAQRKYVYIATSLDGFIAGPNGEIDWLEHDSGGEDYGFAEFIKKIDALIMGSATFKIITDFAQWHYGDSQMIVMSRRLHENDILPQFKDKVSISQGEPSEVLAELQSRGCEQIYVDGGKLVQSFLRAGLIDELIITRFPVILGGGIPLFGELGKQIELRHLETTSFKSGLIQSNYEVKK